MMSYPRLSECIYDVSLVDKLVQCDHDVNNIHSQTRKSVACLRVI